MDEKRQILERVTLLMNYDSARTLDQNKKDLNLLLEINPGEVEDVASALKGSLKGLVKGERNALEKLSNFKKVILSI